MRQWPWPLRWGVRALALVMVLVLLLTAWLVWTVRKPFPTYDGRLTLPGLAGEVTVHSDSHGIPQIYADTPADLFRAQGYVTAQDRFWEMDFRRHITSGRLSELFGDATLDTDKVTRTLGWRKTAEAELALLAPETKHLLEAYAAGVNAWLKANPDTARQSLEYSVLGLQRTGYQPEEWTPADSVAWLKAMAWDLRSNIEDELGRALADTALPKERVDQLYPAYDFLRMPAIVPTGSVADGGFSGEGARSEPPARALSSVLEAIRAMPTGLGNGDSDLGSNSWVIAGSRSATGMPLLANDPHLSAQMPSVWYQAGLHCRTVTEACPYDVTGFTFAGLPGVVIGHNHRIAWGFTNLAPDVSDLYLEKVTGTTAEYKGAQEPLQVRTERIEVAGADPVELTVRVSRHGPIVSDVMDDAEKAAPSGEAVALRWTALGPGRTADAIFAMNRATDWTSFREAARLFEVPAQNLVYADVEGNIGYQAPGRIPVRTAGDGTRPVPGWDGVHEWADFIPFEELPSAFNPDSGYIVTANNAVIGTSYEHLLTQDWSYGYRAQRIDDLVRNGGKLDIAAMSRIQMDDRNGFAPILVPHLLRVGAGVKGIELLRTWDYTQPADSAPAAFFNAVWRHLLLRAFNDELPEGARPDGGDRWFEVVRTLLDKPDDPFWDDVKTTGAAERRDDIVLRALREASDELVERLGDKPGEWRWGALHTLTLTNQSFGTSGIGLVERIFNRGPVELGGGKSIVNAIGWDVQKGYEVTAVPSLRLVADLSNLDDSRYVNLTGASGHAFSDHYWDQTDLWAKGETIPWPFTATAVKEAAEHTLTLTP
ncbi:penicillin acylase family protein [Actinocorallia sp. API 0066]|uniref:penicillin acylase family protein n=1 Tax=Actinocorallia sp. API 0066 TaxID=2896846 RepID=UPI001E52B23B|nr:penicillin acylase family protein [Actinocorallia sp. API 0066]MCD0451801.1 penicillin acylase family protein [Actinocorallia sp. API 0066]